MVPPYKKKTHTHATKAPIKEQEDWQEANDDKKLMWTHTRTQKWALINATAVTLWEFMSSIFHLAAHTNAHMQWQINAHMCGACVMVV